MQGGTVLIKCIGCGALVPQGDGPTHRYMDSSPGCWHVYGEVLSREYGDQAFRVAHRLTVDSYAVQHPGRPTPQSIQSVCIHLISLCLVVERGLTAAYATRVMVRPRPLNMRNGYARGLKPHGRRGRNTIRPSVDGCLRRNRVKREAYRCRCAWTGRSR